jgi:malate dehydrogenase (oxaloacetate-decarboxylating)(NADP+)
MSIEKEALDYHSKFPNGKLGIKLTKPLQSVHDLTMAYTPGVGKVCEAIVNDVDSVFEYTGKGNLVAVISNGTSVLGFGNIGASAAKPVMEGKAVLFKKLAGIDAFDLEINEQDPFKLVQIIKSLEPTFGGINLEDIKAPECFYIEDELKKTMNIPVMHDDQHGTAVVVCAALINALEIANKRIKDIKIVVNGAGSGAIACAKLIISLGASKDNIIMLDSRGVINKDRIDLHESKLYFARNESTPTSLADAIKNADVFLGLSKADVLDGDQLRSMADNPIVFALANPNPEINYELAISSRNDIIFSTGRSDHPNQVNNTLCFPFMFRGALDVRATAITDEMKVAAVHAIADLAREDVHGEVTKIYGKSLEFGRSYILPKPLDPRLFIKVSSAVAKAAIECNVARRVISDWVEYEKTLKKLLVS